MNLKFQDWRVRLGVALVLALLMGAGVAAFSPGSFGAGWLAGGLLLWGAFFALLSAWQWAGAGRALAWMIGLAFFLRLAGGVFLGEVLPVWGYDEPVQKAGFVFYDSFQRDDQAWQLASSDQPVTAAFKQEFANDQYGGLLSISALVYRYLSPDAHRPYLILILTSFFAALGVPFLWLAVSRRWNRSLANWSAWIFALYPESVLLGSSQMREPFLIGLSAVAFWAALNWPRNKKWTLAALIGSLALMSLISLRVALPVAGVLAVFAWLEHGHTFENPRLRVLGWLALGVAALLLVAGSWGWLSSSARLDLKLTWIASGRVQLALKEIGAQFQVPFIMIYGLAQPVLPAVVSDKDALMLWRVLGTLRAVGWYALAPLLIYTLFKVWKAQPARDRRIFLWLMAVTVIWMLVSSLRGGGDQWDNPRYRTMFLVWMALLAAWGVRQAREQKDPWLGRWLMVEVVFVGFFTNWYFSRNYGWFNRMRFWQMVVWIVGLSLLVLVGGWLWDKWRGKGRGARL